MQLGSGGSPGADGKSGKTHPGRWRPGPPVASRQEGGDITSMRPPQGRTQNGWGHHLHRFHRPCVRASIEYSGASLFAFLGLMGDSVRWVGLGHAWTRHHTQSALTFVQCQTERKVLEISQPVQRFGRRVAIQLLEKHTVVVRLLLAKEGIQLCKLRTQVTCELNNRRQTDLCAVGNRKQTRRK